MWLYSGMVHSLSPLFHPGILPILFLFSEKLLVYAWISVNTICQWTLIVILSWYFQGDRRGLLNTRSWCYECISSLKPDNMRYFFYTMGHILPSLAIAFTLSHLVLPFLAFACHRFPQRTERSLNDELHYKCLISFGIERKPDDLYWSRFVDSSIRVKIICVDKLFIIVQVIIHHLFSTKPFLRPMLIRCQLDILGTNFIDICLTKLNFSIAKFNFQVSSANQRPFRLDLSVLTHLGRLTHMWVSKLSHIFLR